MPRTAAQRAKSVPTCITRQQPGPWLQQWNRPKAGRSPEKRFVDRARVETKGQQHSKCWPVQTGASTRAVTQLFCTLDKAGSAARALHAPFTARTYPTRRFLTCTKFLQVNNFERKKKYLYAAPRTGRLRVTNNTIPATIHGGNKPGTCLLPGMCFTFWKEGFYEARQRVTDTERTDL